MMSDRQAFGASEFISSTVVCPVHKEVGCWPSSCIARRKAAAAGRDS